MDAIHPTQIPTAPLPKAPLPALTPEVASEDIHLISHLDATEPIIEPMATLTIQQIEELKGVGGSHVTGDLSIDRQVMDPRLKIAQGLVNTAILLAPTVAGVALAVTGGSFLLGAAAIYLGFKGTKFLAQAGFLQKGLGPIYSAIKEKKMAEPMWSGRRTYQIEADRGPAIDSKVVTQGDLPAVRDPKYISDFLTDHVKAYPSGTTVVHMMGHGLGYRYAAGLPFPAFQQVLGDTAANSGRRPDLLLMESCLVGNFETLAATHDFARYALLSEETVSAGVVGEMLKSTVADNLGRAMTPRELGQEMVRHSGRDDQNVMGMPGAETLALMDMSQVPQLTAAVDKFGSLLAAEAGDGREGALKVAVRGTPCYPAHSLYKSMREKLAIGDLQGFALRVIKIYGGGEMEQTSTFGPIKITKHLRFPEAASSPRAREVQEAAEAVLEAMGKVVVEHQTSDAYQGSGGISIQLPGKKLEAMDEKLQQQGMGTFKNSAAPQGWKDFVGAMNPKM